jgi:predicted AAA+ superfamily ATPase
MKIKRNLIDLIKNYLIPGKVIVVYGPRQVGKTTLMQDLLASLAVRSKFINADELIYRLRNDVGQLWENFLMIERRKANQFTGRFVNTYFWRTYDQKEIDCIEESGGKLVGYEFKWQGGDVRRATRSEFLETYPGSELTAIHRENFESFLID